MKYARYSTDLGKLRILTSGICFAVAMAAAASAQNTYFDTNGATAGVGGGGATTGNWASGAGGAYWTTDSAGISPVPAATSWAASTDKTAIFDATNGLSAATVPLSSGNGVFVSGLIFKVGGYTISPAASGAGFNLQKAHTIEVDAGTATISAVFLGTVGYNVTGGGTLLLTNASNTITGPVNVSGGSTLELATSSQIGGTSAGAGDVTLATGTLRNDSTTNGNVFVTPNRGIILGTGGGHVSANGGAGIVTIYTGLISGAGPLTVDGNGTFRLTTTTATYTGATVVNGKLQISTTANVLPSGTDVTVNSGGVFDVQNNQTINSLAGAGNVTSASSPTLIIAGSTNTAYSGVISGSGIVTKSGGSTITIANDWTNTGATNINAGTLKFGTGAAGLSSGSAVTIASGATLDMNSINDSMGTIAGGGSITNNNGTTGLTIVGTGSTNFSGSITGTSSLTKSSASTGTTTLSGDNTVKNLNINAGTFTVTGSNTISGAVNITGNGTLSASSGRINFNNNNAAGSADIFVTGLGAEIANSASSITTSNTIHLDGGAPTGITDSKLVQIQSTSGNSWNISGKITGNGGLLRDNDGAGAVTLSGANDFSGGFFITARDVTAGSKNAFGTGTVTVGDPVNAPTTAISLKSAADLSGANAVGNAVTVNQDFGVAGTNKLELSGNVNLGAVNRTVTVTNSADTTVSGVIGDGGSGTGALSKAGSGKLILTNGNSNYGGGTIVTAGTLLANNTTSSATGSGNIGVTGGVFGGTGAVSGSVSVSGTGTLSPGASVGALATGALSFFSGATLKYEIDSTAPLVSAADLLDANGGLSIAAGSLLAFSDVAGTPVMVPVGSRLTMISYLGPWDGGTFNGAADDSVITLNGDYYVINYNDENAGSNFGGGSFGNYVTLTAVPEVNASLLGGLVTLMVGVVIGGRKLINKAPAA